MSNSEIKIEFNNALNEAGWALLRELNKYGGITGHMFNNLKPSLKVAIERYMSEVAKEKLIPQSKEVEWNGEGLPPVGVECWFNFKNKTPEKCKVNYIGERVCVYEDKEGEEYSIILGCVDFSRVETEAERVERERLESAYDLYCEFTNSKQEDATCMSMYGFEMSSVQYKWLAIVDKTNYRKES